MWWFGWQPSEAENLTLEEIERWLNQAQRQIKAQYTKATL
ncbi:GpE family phage tail protein [Pasteurella multocida]|nr:GpE family phage tail protein [Pasteurella multocida]NNI07732.1 GpE family phage tail protein [Pasteurella multocida]NNI33474.1 GpE family phage tail protein [Pasteurella multocida]